MDFEVDERGRPKISDPLPPPPTTSRRSKAYRQYQAEKKRRKFRTIMQLRRMAEVAFYKANVLGDLAAMEFISDRIDGKPSTTANIAVSKDTNLKVKLTYDEAREKLLSLGIDTNRVPLLSDMQRPEPER